ncbi:hypothetical protein GCM10025779_00970 [Arthrobacter cryoconiti]
MIAIVDAESRHPKPSDGDTVRFPAWDQPYVKASRTYGRAVAYTRTYGLIFWLDDSNGKHFEWFPADMIQRVTRDDWHGR